MKFVTIMCLLLGLSCSAPPNNTVSRKKEKTPEKKIIIVKDTATTNKDTATTKSVAPTPNLGDFEEIIVPTDTRHNVPALLHMPKGEPGEKFPIIVCFHGKSIAGHDITKLFRAGIPREIHEGRKIQAVNKLDGKLYKFIVLAPLAEIWGIKPNGLKFILDDVLKRFPVDPSRIYLTGYSAGGWCTMMAMTEDRELSSMIAATVPMSPAPMYPVNYTRFNYVTDNNIHAWYFAGDAEPQFLQNVIRCIDSTNSIKKGLVKFTHHGYKHCCWAEFYNPGYRDPEEHMSIYQWLLQYKKR
jgi:predicted peptidase